MIVDKEVALPTLVKVRECNGCGLLSDHLEPHGWFRFKALPADLDVCQECRAIGIAIKWTSRYRYQVTRLDKGAQDGGEGG